MKITKQKLRRLIKETIDVWDPIDTINQILADSTAAISTAVHDNVKILLPNSHNYYDYKEGSKSNILTYQFMSTWGAHDDGLWNRSTTKARQIILNALLSAGATITGPVPVMNDFGTPGVKFVLDGQKFILSTTGYRYDVEIYVVKDKQ